MPTHIMVDLETLGTTRDAPILTIGAVAFDPWGDGATGNQFDARIMLKSYDDAPLQGKFTVNFGTLTWWFGQNEQARQEAFADNDKRRPRVPLRLALSNLLKWLTAQTRDTGYPLHLWSQGKEFDVPILEYAIERCGLRVPWKFWNTRDTRTAYGMCGVNSKDVPVPDGCTAHEAICDCVRQIVAVQRAHKKIRLTNNDEGDWFTMPPPQNTTPEKDSTPKEVAKTVAVPCVPSTVPAPERSRIVLPLPLPQPECVR